MAKLIVKSPYIKCGGGNSAAGYLNYIGTRENVELIPDDRPPTRKQEQLIAKLVKDFPDTKKSFEYEDYCAAPTKAKASAFITLALEANWSSVQKRDGYMSYIATRPRAERLSSHGLFGDEDNVSLDDAKAELDSYTGNVWTHIISLRREDAARLGFDNARAWRALIRSHRNEIAEAMHIQPNNLRWYAAFHDEGDHPHIHMMAWSTDTKEAYLSKEGIRQIKSKLTNTIFQDEMLYLYEQKSESRDELVREARNELMRMVKLMSEGLCDHPEAEQLMQQLAVELGSVKGKKQYGYLPKAQKELVCQIVDQMERLPVVQKCYDRWLELQGKVDSCYHDREQERPRLSEQKEFTAIRNAVIKEAERIRTGEMTFEDKDIHGRDEPQQFQNSSYEFDALWDVIRDEDISIEERLEAVAAIEDMAMQDDSYAQYLMGTLYRDGPLLVPDSEKAKLWLTRAAENKHLAAMYALGKLFLSEYDALDVGQGMKWLETAAEYGHDYAMYRLGKEYLSSKHVPKDAAKAVEWFEQAAEQENPFAQYMLGKLYLIGKDVLHDKEQALRYLTAAADQGNRYAQFFVEHIDENRSPQLMLGVTRLLYHMSRIFQNNSLPKSTSTGIQIDRKRLKRLREKKMAMGHKANDHEEYSGPSMSM